MITDEVRADLATLVADLVKQDWSDFAPGGVAHDDEDGCEITTMCLTVGTTDGTSWDYQTGDNSYAGGAYGCPHWAVVYIGPDTDPAETVAEIVDQWEDLIAQSDET